MPCSAAAQSAEIGWRLRFAARATALSARRRRTVACWSARFRARASAPAVRSASPRARTKSPATLAGTASPRQAGCSRLRSKAQSSAAMPSFGSAAGQATPVPGHMPPSRHGSPAGPHSAVAGLRPRAADGGGGLQAIRRAGRARAGAGLGDVAGTRGRPALVAARPQRVERADIGHAVAALRGVTWTRRRTADVRALRVGRARRVLARAELGDVARPRNRPAFDGRGRELVLGAVGAVAGAELAHVAHARCGAALGARPLQDVLGTLCALARAQLRHVARPRGRPAGDGRGLEAVGGTLGTLARAQLRLVTGTGSGPALDAGRLQAVRRAARARSAAALGGVAVAGGRAAHRALVARHMEARGGAVAHVARARVAVVGADRARRVGHAARACTLLAAVVCRARVGVVARRPIGLEAAAAEAVEARVPGRAGVVVVADRPVLHDGARAEPIQTGICVGARVAVVAWGAVRERGIAAAEALRAHIVARARVAVVAGGALLGGYGVAAAGALGAGVVRRARVAVVAGPLHLHAAPAGPLLAAVVGGALAAVVARRAVAHGRVHAAVGAGARVARVAGVADAGIEAVALAREVAREAEGIRARGGHHDQQSESAKCRVPLHGDRLTRATPMPEKARESAARRAALLCSPATLVSVQASIGEPHDTHRRGRAGKMSDERRGALCVPAAALLWSTGGVAIKAVAEPALKVACYRSAVAAVVLAAFFRPRLWRATLGFQTAIVSYAGCLTTFVVATKWTSAANAIFLQYSGVVWILVLAPLVLGEPFSRRDAGAIAVAFLGMALFFVGELDPRGRAGDLVALVSGLLYALLVLSLRRERGIGAEAAVTYGNVLAAGALLPFVGPAFGVAARSGGILVFLGVVQIAGAYVLFLRGLRHVPATRASLIGMIGPIGNPCWVFLLLGEAPRALSLVGGAIVLGAVAWRTATLGRAPAAAMAPPD